MQPGGSVFLWRLASLLVVAGVVTLALFLYHRRRSYAIATAHYHLKADTLHWRRVSLLGRKKVWVCPDCGTLAPDLKALEMHVAHHEAHDTLSDRLYQAEKLVAELLGGEPRKEIKEPPWTAVVDPVVAPELEEENA